MPLFSPRGRAAVDAVVRRTLDQMQGLGRIATEAALGSLGKLVQQEVEVRAPRVAIVPRDHLAQQFHHLADHRVGARFSFTGGLDGAVATLFTEAEARRLVDLLLGNDDGATDAFGDLEDSALAEMTNIALNNALNAVGTETGNRFTPSVPAVDRAIGAAFFDALEEALRDHDHGILVETRFREGSRGVEGVLVLLFGVRAGAA